MMNMTMDDEYLDEDFLDEYLDLYLRELRKYVGKVYWESYNEVLIVDLYGGIAGKPFYMCKWEWSDDVFCADPLEVLSYFDDDGNPIDIPDGA